MNAKPDWNAIYRILSHVVRQSGWRVHNTVTPMDSYGDIDVYKKVIRIDRRLSIQEKITTLAHEYGHAAQADEVFWSVIKKKVGKTKKNARPKARIKKYKSYLFYWRGKRPYSEANWQIIKYCEVDASKRAYKVLTTLFPELLDKFGDGTLVLHELNANSVNTWLRDGWLESYCL
jgi:hypothetical protein